MNRIIIMACIVASIARTFNIMNNSIPIRTVHSILQPSGDSLKLFVKLNEHFRLHLRQNIVFLKYNQIFVGGKTASMSLENEEVYLSNPINSEGSS